MVMSSTAAELLDELGLGAPMDNDIKLSKVPVFVRELSQEDVQSTLLRKEYGTGQTAPIAQKLRYAHHTLARLLAEGKDNVECSAITGYGVAYINMIKADPAFKDLVAHYSAQVSQQYLDVHARLATLGTTAMEVLQERLNDPDLEKKITIRELKEIFESAFDRSVAPNKSNGGPPQLAINAPKTLNIHFGAPVPTGLPTGSSAGVRSLPGGEAEAGRQMIDIMLTKGEKGEAK
jgi:hypothetical protein